MAGRIFTGNDGEMTITMVTRENRLSCVSKNVLATSQETRDATATLALWLFRTWFLGNVSPSPLTGGIRATASAGNGRRPHPRLWSKRLRF